MDKARMMKAAVVAVLAMVSGARAQDVPAAGGPAAPQGVLVITVTGFKHGSGLAVANVYRNGDNIFRKAPIRLAGKIVEGKAEMSVQDIPYGEYGVCVFHDENGDGKLTHTFFGTPGEPIGYSNNFEWGFLAGYPSFERMKFTFSPESKNVEVTVR